ncbi:hypothetical protein N7539_001572 [Penicillium diatomitis]|uniref:Zinc finger PHD-type domain-containing protein n=1 Tax=Penicillium diatomitis TaxID=2819901 RepID=A0A9W9XH15_9EURO|nr:uncharacterized protein N7539_001572 [Penicillium diatomitis]KAJ5492826.1 hypothetical protein N7539_001572 [Penicillium diatomitis]
MPGRSNSTHVNGAIDDDKTTSAMANPYETDPDVIPSDDPFLAQSIHYGRYTPKPHDFVPTPQHKHWHQSEPESKAFWEEFTREHCIPDNSLNLPGSREAFAVGGVIVRVDTDTTHGAASERFSCVNANEISAARKVEDALKDIGIAVPIIYFCGTVEGKNVTVESRIPGTSLDVAWRYFNTDQIMVLKNQCRQIIHHLATIDSASEEPSYVCRGLNSQSMPSTSDQERTILFAPRSSDEVLNLTHNDLTPANLIVKDDRIVGISGWRNCGYFGLERAKKVHQSLREWKCYGSDENRGASWIDIYDNGYDPSICGPLVSTEDDHSPVVKAEPSGTTIEKYPPREDLNFKSMGYDGTGDYLSSKKLASLKNGGGISRASSADRSSPAASVKAPSNKKGSSAATKKGTAKKPVSRKRKANDADTESIDGRRSNTPASRAGKASGKKQSSVSIAGSPAPEDKKRRSRMQPRDDDEDEDVEDENELFCICRRPDNHTWMIGCDGECEDWFHGKCVNIDPRDAELIDKYICESPNIFEACFSFLV